MSRSGSSTGRALGLVAALVAAGACGKKGPPLAPLIPIPAGIDQIGATRVGNDVYVTLTVPSANIDQFSPASIDRIDVYGYTGRTAPPRARWVEFGTLVATVPVAPPPDPTPPPASAPPPDKPIAPAPAARAPQQGAQVTIVDTLTADELVQGRQPAVEPGTPTREPGTGTETGTGTGTGTRTDTTGTGTRTSNQKPEPGTRNVELPPLRRFYTAFPWSPRGRPGPPGANAELALLPVPDAPSAVSLTYDASALRLAWDPSGGVIGYLLERALPEEELPLELEERMGTLAPAGPQAPILYNVYRTTSPDPFAPPPDAPLDEAWTRRSPTPINPVPLSTFEFSDTVAFNEERCYTVRGVRGIGPDARVGIASAPACVTAVDTFAPEPPSGLATVAAEGAINLIWEPNVEPDLGGYIVLRGHAPDDTLQPLTTEPIREASYRDTQVTAGVRYVYAVVAMDNRFPVPNLSAPSGRAEEVAR